MQSYCNVAPFSEAILSGTLTDNKKNCLDCPVVMWLQSLLPV